MGWRVSSLLFGAWLALATQACATLSQAPDLSGRLDELLQPKVQSGGPGMAVAVGVAGQVVYARGFGLADLEKAVPITPDTLFYAASVSKQFTAACLAALVADGVVEPDTPVRTVLPEVAPLYEAVTLRHLVHHTSGIRDFYRAMEEVGHHPLFGRHTPELVMDLLNGEDRLDFRPGSQYSYSNSNYFLIARAVERLTGESLEEFARRRFFQPLGLASTHFQHDPEAPVPGRAFAYRLVEGEYVRHQARSPLPGAGGLNTTVLDLVRWDHALAGGILGDEFTRLVHTRGRAGRTRIAYAWGLQMRVQGGQPTVGHGGSLAGFRTALIRYPREDLTVAVLANFAEAAATITAREVAEAVLALPRRARQPEPFFAQAGSGL